MQLTDPRPSSKDLWNWKSNIEGANRLLRGDKVNFVRNYVLTIAATIDDWNVGNPGNKIVNISDLSEGGFIYSHSLCTHFADDVSITEVFPDHPLPQEKSILDAMIMKAYNGLSGGQFYQLTMYPGEKPIWTIDRGPNDYVARVSSEFVPTR